MEEKEMLQLIYDELCGVKKDVSGLKEDVSGLKEDVSGLKEDVSNLEKKVTDIQLTLENETNRNIKIIAEGHLDLARKLDEAVKKGMEDELLKIQVNVLENDVRRLKEQRGVPI